MSDEPLKGWEPSNRDRLAATAPKAYQCRCIGCRELFIGHKRDLRCAVCVDVADAATPAGEQAAPLVASLTDEQIEALWRKWVGTSRPNYSFARAILATTEAPREPEPVLGFGKIVGTYGKVEKWPSLQETALDHPAAPQTSVGDAT